MDSKSYRDFLLSSISSASSASGGSEINCRCFYCPDSADKSHGHFYISIPKTENEPSFYCCFKCQCSGIVTHKTLIEWGIYDEQIAIDITKQNQAASKNEKYSSSMSGYKYKLLNYKTRYDEGSEIKRNYINQRLGTNMSFEEMRDLKIVLNLNDLLECNGITRVTRNTNIVSQLDGNFIGFISIDNAFLNMRRVCDKGLVYKDIDKKYINYKIFDKFDTSERFYTVPTAVDLNSSGRIKIHIAEGPFDILSIYKNLRNREPGIYSSIAGNNYMGLVYYFLSNYMIPYSEFHIYPDNDDSGSKWKINKINQYLKSIGIPCYIHRNTYPGEKDFGVPLNRINEKIIMI